MAKVFLSHSSAQKTLVTNIANRIGWDNCILDKYHFEAGEPTLEEIFKGIDKSDLFVLFLSEEALNSTWVKRELEYANNFKDPEIKRRLLLFLIDRKINHTDSRIPSWLAEQYDLKTITDEIIIYKKIDSKLRDISIDNYPQIKAREEIFIGRNKLMDEFESKYHQLDNVKPSCIIASGFEEIGRRKFLKNALDKNKKLNKFHNPVSITLNSRDSIENFIINIEDLNSKNPEQIIEKIKDIELDAKIQYAKELLLQFKQQNEILFIIDRGCIIQPNKHVADWFEKLVSDEEFKSVTVVCVISSIRPFNSQIVHNRKYLAIHLNELSPSDIRILFIRYCNEIFKIKPEQEISEQIISLLNGMPGQVYHATELLANVGASFITKRFEEIKKYNDVRVFHVIEQIKKEGELFPEILIFLSKIEYVSYNLVYRIFGRTTEVESALEKLFVYGVFDHIGIDKEYIQTHYAISDYINRAKLKISDSTRVKLKSELKKILEEESEYRDVSQILLTIKSLVQDGLSIPDKLLIPSFVLRIIVDSYYAGHYQNVEELALNILGRKEKYDSSIVREIRYWLCQSLARKYSKSPNANHNDFFEHIKEFDGADHYFLLGFYFRLLRKMPEAEKNFTLALERDQYSQKAKRELVNVLLSQHRYGDAIKMAEDNYERSPLNAFHIQAYFMCLIRKPSLTKRDKESINDLLNSIKISHDFKADEINKCMLAECKYYLNDDITGSIEMLQKVIKEATFKNYPRRALLEIYRKRGFRNAEQELMDEIQSSDSNSYLE
ncbi:MAG: toll/interleukin-1 receptor domain-containing protein [Bacteroidia bacterium]|jgi:hypothetical protein